MIILLSNKAALILTVYTATILSYGAFAINEVDLMIVLTLL